MASQDFTGIVNNHQDRVVSTLGEATQYLNTLSSFLNQDFNVHFPNSSINIGGNVASGLYNFLLSRPSALGGLEFNTPPAPGAAPTSFDVAVANPVNIPDTVTPPEINIPTKPVLSDPVAPTSPEVANVNIPITPDLQLPDVPTLSSVTFPDAPTLEIPLFNEQFPNAPDLLIPSNDFPFQEEEYGTELLTQIQSKLVEDIADGTYGLDPNVEQQLWDRERDREQQASLGQEEDAIRAFASKGFQAPPGILVEIVSRARQATLDKISSVNRDIAINRSDLQLKAREIAISQGISVEQMLLTDHGFKQERALNVAKFSADLSFKVLDAQISRYNAQISAFEAFAGAYETQVRAQLAKTEIFKAEVEAAAARQEADRTQVQIYQAQLEGVRTLVGLFEAEMGAAQIATEIERNKVAIFGTQVEAYLAQVQARNSEMQLYETEIRGEAIKTDIYQAQVAGFDSQVRAAKIQSDIDATNIASDIEKAKLELAAYTTQIDRYRIDLDREVSRIGTLLDQNKQESEIYRTVMDGWEQMGSLDLGVLQESGRVRADEIKVQNDQMNLIIQNLHAEVGVRQRAAEKGIDLFAGLVQQAEAATSAIAIDEGA